MEKIVCTRKKFKKDKNSEKGTTVSFETVECDKIKVFCQKGKAQINDKDIIDSVFVHYRDHKGRPVQLGLRENPEVVKTIREKIFAEFGPIKIKAEGNLTAFSGQPCVEWVVAADASCYERNRFSQFNYAKAELGLWKFDQTQKPKLKIRRINVGELAAAAAEKRLSASLGKLGDIHPELAGIRIDTSAIAESVNKRKK